MKKLIAITLFFYQASYAQTATLGDILANNGGKLPIPFSELMKASGATQKDAVLIPRGRSLVAKDNDDQNPRILLNPGASTSSEVPSKLIIGYSPKTDSLEITSWNPNTKTYDFIEVANYSKPSEQKINRAHEGKCTTCHTDNRLLLL